MTYVTIENLQGYFPDFFISKGTDDNKKGSMDSDVLNTIIDATVQKVKGLFAPGYTVPEIEPVPSFVYYVMTLLTVDQIYKRRGQADHVWKSDVEAALEKIKAISEGTLDIEAIDYNYFGTVSELEKKVLLFGDINARGAY